MKKVTIIICSLILLGFACYAWAWGVAGVSGGQGAAGGGASVQKDSQTSTGSTDWFATNDKWYAGGSFVAGSSYTLTRVDVYLSKGGSPTFNATGRIFATSGESPTGAALATSTNTPAVSSLGAACGTLQFDFAGLALTNGTTYSIIVEGHGDGANYINACYTAGSRGMFYSIDASTWTNWHGSSDIAFVSYGY
jgi:hypothetical protein